MHLRDKVARSTRPILILLTIGAVVAAAAPAPAKPNHGSAMVHAACQTNTNSMQQLAQISNTRDTDVQCLGVTLDGNAVTALRIETHRFVRQTDTATADTVLVAEFPVAAIESRRGAVLDGTPGHDAVIVHGEVPPAGGNVVLVASYLYNGLTGEYRRCRMTLDRRTDNAWRLVNQFNETVSRIVVRTRRVPVLGTIGIADLEGACTPTQS